MSKKSNETCAVDAELLYEAPDKRRKTRSRKAAKPEPTLSVAEIECLFASYRRVLRNTERDIRKLLDDGISLMEPLVARIHKGVIGERQGVKALLAQEELLTTLHLPLSLLAKHAGDLCVELYKAERFYRTFAALYEEDQTEDSK